MSVRASPACAAPIGQTAMRPGLFGGGLFGGSAAGFLGAGLFGLLFGHGFFGGMAGFTSIIGLLLHVMRVVIVARLIFAWWQRRNMPAPAYAAAHSGLDTALAVSVECWPALMHHRPANLLPSPSRTMTRSNDCSATSKQVIRRKTFRTCARRSRPRCCPISPSSWQATKSRSSQSVTEV
jgi:predicted lipid-binding transport protein (Tim44 family)